MGESDTRAQIEHGFREEAKAPLSQSYDDCLLARSAGWTKQLTLYVEATCVAARSLPCNNWAGEFSRYRQCTYRLLQIASS